MSRSPEIKIDAETKRTLLNSIDTRNRGSLFGNESQRHSSENRSPQKSSFYFRERAFLKDTGRQIDRIHSRFNVGSLGATLRKEKKSDLINDMIVEKQIEKEYNRYLQRQHKISRYFNQNFDHVPTSTSSKFGIFKHTTRDHLHQRFASSVSPIGNLQNSISNSRDRLHKNEVVFTSKENTRDPIDESVRQLTTHARMSLGVFGGFDVSV